MSSVKANIGAADYPKNRNRCILQQETATLDVGRQVTDPVYG
ncbi:MAG: hypothetical protein ACYDBW_05245 [Sulfuricaulis sp.]